ncbi:electron transport complex subunit RsxC [Buchnera aphidicola]|uniref:electron transport complex subunit RsxC n=1 Tax=Buchnera aphidicola TaxID=9 RepID=UPI003464447A
MKVRSFLYKLKYKIIYYINKLKKENIFFGGLRVASHKPINHFFLLKSIPIPSIVYIPIKNYLIRKQRLLVSLGDKVSTGEPLTVGDINNVVVHSPISGIITNININDEELYFDNKETIITIQSNGKQNYFFTVEECNYKLLKKSEILRKIYQFGIVGLGGGGFSSASKLQMFIPLKYNTLIVNAAECEPYIVADECLIHNYIDEILKGCEILVWTLGIKIVLIAIENSKLKTIEIIQRALLHYPDFQLRVIPSIYPSGSGKQLIQTLFDEELPFGMHASSMGILIHNVGTLFAIKRAIINNIPLIERIVTIAGNNVFNTENYWIRIGTPISYLLKYILIKSIKNNQIFLGGPFTGKPFIQNFSVILKTVNCILLMNNNKILKSLHQQRECIRCSACSNVCPMRLLPQQLYWYSRVLDHSKTQFYNIMDCIECGACEQVCPSKINLVHYYKKEKKIVIGINREKNRIEDSKIRFQNRLKRINVEYDDDQSYNNFLFNQFKEVNFNNTIIQKNMSNLDKIKSNLNTITKDMRRNIIKNAILKLKKETK